MLFGNPRMNPALASDSGTGPSLGVNGPTKEQLSELKKAAEKALQSSACGEQPSLSRAQAMRAFHVFANPETILYLLAEREALLRPQ